MAKITPNLGLVNPELGKGEKYTLEEWTQNNDKLDAAVGNKVDKVAGKGLSKNDFTDALKTKLETEIPAQLADITKLTLKVENKIKNGDFALDSNADGLADFWTTLGSPAVSILGNVTTYIPTIAGNNFRQDLAPASGKKIYISADVHVPVGEVGIHAYNSVYINAKNTTDFVNLSAIITGQDTSTRLFFYNFADAIGQPISVKNPIAIDLTAVFGAGKEPTYLQMRAWLSKYPDSWFNGTIDFTNMAEIYKDAKDGIDKIALLNGKNDNVIELTYVGDRLTNVIERTATNVTPLRSSVLNYFPDGRLQNVEQLVDGETIRNTIAYKDGKITHIFRAKL